MYGKRSGPARSGGIGWKSGAVLTLALLLSSGCASRPSACRPSLPPELMEPPPRPMAFELCGREILARSTSGASLSAYCARLIESPQD